MGRKPKPLALHVLEGTYREDRHGDVQLPLSIPVRPKWLKGAAADEWGRCASLLASRGILTEADQTVLALCCQAYADYLDAKAEVAKHGTIAISGDNGAPYQHPAVSMMNKHRESWLKFAVELGLTPSARCGLKISPPKQDAGVRTRKRG